jgi:hypothetical protein
MNKPRWLYALGLVGIATTSPAAQVKGKIAGAEKLLPDVYTEIAKAEHRYTWREASPATRPDFRVLSANPSRDICIAATTTSGAASPHADLQIVVTGGHTVFTTIAVSPQTKLIFVSHDVINHRLYLVGDPGFKETDMSPGTTREWVAPGTGRYEFRDRLAPTLRFFVVVDPGVVDIIFPSHSGAFNFTNLPTGDYFIKAFFNGKQVGKPVQAVAMHGNVDLKEPLQLEEAK